MTNLTNSGINTTLALAHLAYGGILPDLSDGAVNTLKRLASPTVGRMINITTSGLTNLPDGNVLAYLSNGAVHARNGDAESAGGEKRHQGKESMITHGSR